MDYVVDTNVLLASTQGDPEVGRAIEMLVAKEIRLCVLTQNSIELWNVCTRPLSANGFGLPTNDASERDVEFLFHRLPESDAVYDARRNLVRRHAVSGKQVHDARIAAAIGVQGIDTILTYNGRDFTRYPGISGIHPAEVTL